MTTKSFNLDEFIEQSTELINRLNKYTENNTPSPELVDAMEGLYSDLSNFNNTLEEVEVKNEPTHT